MITLRSVARIAFGPLREILRESGTQCLPDWDALPHREQERYMALAVEAVEKPGASTYPHDHPNAHAHIAAHLVFDAVAQTLAPFCPSLERLLPQPETAQDFGPVLPATESEAAPPTEAQEEGTGPAEAAPNPEPTPAGGDVLPTPSETT